MPPRPPPASEMDTVMLRPGERLKARIKHIMNMNAFKDLKPEAGGAAIIEALIQAMDDPVFFQYCEKIAKELSRLDAKTAAEVRKDLTEEALRDIMAKMNAMHEFSSEKAITDVAAALKRFVTEPGVSDEESAEPANSTSASNNFNFTGGASASAGTFAFFVGNRRAPASTPRSIGRGGRASNTRSARKAANAQSNATTPSAAQPSVLAASPSVSQPSANAASPSASQPGVGAATPSASEPTSTSSAPSTVNAPSTTSGRATSSTPTSVLGSRENPILAMENDEQRLWLVEIFTSELFAKFNKKSMAKQSIDELNKNLKVLTQQIWFILEWVSDVKTGKWNDNMSEPEAERTNVIEAVWEEVRVLILRRKGKDGVEGQTWVDAYYAVRCMVNRCRY